MGVASEEIVKKLSSPGQIGRYLDGYFYVLHVLHIIALMVSCLVVVLSFIHLVPQNDDDIKFAFHFVVSISFRGRSMLIITSTPRQTIFIIFTVALTTLYASFVALQKPCLDQSASGECCTLHPTPGLLSSSEKPSITAFSLEDHAMLAVMGVDLVVGIMLLMIAFCYFRDVRHEAQECGYLYRVHNEGYIIR